MLPHTAFLWIRMDKDNLEHHRLMQTRGKDIFLHSCNILAHNPSCPLNFRMWFNFIVDIICWSCTSKLYHICVFTHLARKPFLTSENIFIPKPPLQKSLSFFKSVFSLITKIDLEKRANTKMYQIQTSIIDTSVMMLDIVCILANRSFIVVFLFFTL